MKPVLRYFGAKWAIADWIVAQMPPHTCYVEVFGGSAAVLLTKARSEHEVLNDIDEEVIAFFLALREHPYQLAKAIETTPFSRREWQLAREPSDDPIERARRFYVRSWQTRGGYRRDGQLSWQYTVTARSRSRHVERWQNTEDLGRLAERLLGVMVECADWRDLFRRFDTPETLFYLDPPYLQSTRAAKYEYLHEMGEDEHRELLAAANGLDGMAMISGYPSELYEAELCSWRRHTKEARAVSGAKRVECLWLNPAAAALPKQRRLWS